MPAYNGLPENWSKIQQLASLSLASLPGSFPVGAAAAGLAAEAPAPAHCEAPLEFQVGDLVYAKDNFSSDSEEPARLLAGQRGTIVLVDDDGDAYIHFDNVPKKQWVYRSNYGHLTKVPPSKSGISLEAPTCEGDRPAEQQGTFAEGDAVVVTADFASDSEEPAQLLRGQRGRVVKIDGDGDAYVQFEDHGPKQWVYSANYCNLAKAAEICSVCGRPGGAREGRLDDGQWFCLSCWASWEEAERESRRAVQAAQAGTAEGDDEPPPVPAPAALWKFEPPADKGFALRSRPDMDAPRAGGLLQPGEVFRVSEEHRGSDGILYLQLANGRGWTFEGRAGVGTLCRQLEEEEAAAFLELEAEEAEAAEAPLPVEPFTVARAKELLILMRTLIEEEKFQESVANARRLVRSRPLSQRDSALRSRVGVLFAQACGDLVKEFGFNSDRKGFESMFKALHGYQDDLEIFRLAMEVECLLHVQPGAWFYIDPLRAGATVYLCGLESAPHLNGAAGVLKAFDEERGRWKVHLDEEDEVKLVLPANLSVRSPDEESSEDEEEALPASSSSQPRRHGSQKAQPFDELEAPWWVAAGQVAAAKAAKTLAVRAANMRAIEWAPPPPPEPPADTEDAAGEEEEVPKLFHVLEGIDRQDEEEETREAFASLAKPSTLALALLDEDLEDENVRKTSFERIVPKLGGIDRKKFKEVAAWGARKDASLLSMTGDSEEGSEAILTVEERGLLTPEHQTPLKQLQAWKERQNRPHPKSVGLMPKRTPLGLGVDRRQGDMAGMASGQLEGATGAAAAARTGGALGFSSSLAGPGSSTGLPAMALPWRQPPPGRAAGH